jgi:hypothetical protein
MKKIVLIISFLMILCPAHLYAWDGYDYDTDDYIEFDHPFSVKPGNDVEIYDYSDESYHDVYVISINRDGTVIIEVFDYDTGDYRTFEMRMEAAMLEKIGNIVI